MAFSSCFNRPGRGLRSVGDMAGKEGGKKASNQPEEGAVEMMVTQSVRLKKTK